LRRSEPNQNRQATLKKLLLLPSFCFFRISYFVFFNYCISGIDNFIITCMIACERRCLPMWSCYKLNLRRFLHLKSVVEVTPVCPNKSAATRIRPP
jgi:hypothetical protein